MFSITVQEQITEIERELGLRRRVYPKWVDAGKMKQATAEYRIEVLEGVLDTLRSFKDGIR